MSRKDRPSKETVAPPGAAASMPEPASKPGAVPKPPARPKEIGEPEGPEPTRYGDWEKNGRCSDF